MFDGYVDVKTIENLLGYVFSDKQLLFEAFTHSGYAEQNCLPFDNERLEHLGDAVLGLVATDYLYYKFADVREGKLSKMRDAVVSAKGLTSAVNKLGILQYLKTADKQARESKKVPSSLFEAVVGAIYVDGGIDEARRFVLRNLQTYLDKADGLVANPKSDLQEKCQQAHLPVPEYKLVSKLGPDNAPTFTVQVTVNGKSYTGVGKTKRTAEESAAEIALKEMEN